MFFRINFTKIFKNEIFLQRNLNEFFLHPNKKF